VFLVIGGLEAAALRWQLITSRPPSAEAVSADVFN